MGIKEMLAIHSRLGLGRALGRSEPLPRPSLFLSLMSLISTVELKLMWCSMAWMEMRILIAKMVFLFDYELVDDALDFERDSSAFILWHKPELWTKVTARDVL
jgi:hypothetical protein